MGTGGEGRGGETSGGWYPESMGSPSLTSASYLPHLGHPFTSLAISLLSCKMTLTAAPFPSSSWGIDVQVLRALKWFSHVGMGQGS